MSFIYGGNNTKALAGVTATLTEWPSLGGLAIESIDMPGRDGRFFAGASRSHSSFVFDVLIEGSTPTEAAARRDNFVGLLDPSRGPQPLMVEIDTAWIWRDVLVSADIQWGRLVWERGLGFTFRADVSFETQGDSAAFEAVPQVVNIGAVAGSFTLATGNTSAYPVLEFATGAACVVTIGGYSLSLAATTGGTAVLDWDSMEFYVRNGAGARVSSLVPKMSNYSRPVLKLGQAVAVSVKRGTPYVACKLYPNARRI